jgi:hypothetical protein
MKIPFDPDALRSIADALENVNSQLEQTTFWSDTPGVDMKMHLEVFLHGDSSNPIGHIEWYDDWLGFWPAFTKEDK